MSGVTLQIDSPRLEAALAALDDLARLPERDELLEALGGVAESGARRRISDEKAAPDGTPWAPWSARYAKTRRAKHSLLVGGGDLRDDLHSELRGDEIHVGVSLVYGAIHQLGGEAVGKNIPARPFLGVSDQDEDEMLEVVSDFVELTTAGRAR